MIRVATAVILALLAASPALASAGGGGGAIPWKGFIFALINFTILLWLIAKPIRRMLSGQILEKHRRIKEAFDEANAAIAKAGERAGHYKKLLDGLPAEIAAIEKEAREEMEREKAAFARELEEGRKRVEEYAREMADQEIRAARALLVGEAVAAIAARAERIAAERVGPSEDRAIVAAAAERLGGR